jgi:uncharacterized protein (DUF2225 family)
MHHEEEHGHHHEPGSHPSGFVHHAGECPYCHHGKFKSKEEEVGALQKFKEDISRQLNYIDKRIEELTK